MSLQTRFDKIEQDILEQRLKFKESDKYFEIPITFDTYQAGTTWTAQYPTKHMPDTVYLSLGLADEVGEILGKIKKLYRDKDGNITGDFIKDIEKELGDVLYYLSALAYNLDISMERIACLNQEKLLDRLRRNVLKGDGDNR